MSREDSEVVHIEKHTSNPGVDLLPRDPLCLLFDILSKGLNNNQTA